MVLHVPCSLCFRYNSWNGNAVDCKCTSVFTTCFISGLQNLFGYVVLFTFKNCQYIIEIFQKLIRNKIFVLRGFYRTSSLVNRDYSQNDLWTYSWEPLAIFSTCVYCCKWQILIEIRFIEHLDKIISLFLGFSTIADTAKNSLLCFYRKCCKSFLFWVLLLQLYQDVIKLGT